MYSKMGCVYDHTEVELRANLKSIEYALELFRKSLDIRIKEYDPEHSSVAITCSNMFEVFTNQGKCKEAIAPLKNVGLLEAMKSHSRRLPKPSQVFRIARRFFPIAWRVFPLALGVFPIAWRVLPIAWRVWPIAWRILPMVWKALALLEKVGLLEKLEAMK